MKRGTVGITGISGFIGSALSRHLDRVGIGYVGFVGDLLNDEDVGRFFKDGDFEQVVHLVGTFNPPFENLIRLNVTALQKLLEHGTKRGLKKIILSSTGAVYGEPIGTESFETDPLKPNTLYGVSKMYAEECVHYYTRTTGLEFVIIRFPNVYGKGNGKGVIDKFIKGIRETGTVTINGDGTQSRNFLHIDDACRAIELCLKFKGSDIFNITNPEKVSINDLVDVLKKRYSFSVRHEPANNNLKHLLLNGDKARSALRFSPKIRTIKI